MFSYIKKYPLEEDIYMYGGGRAGGLRSAGRRGKERGVVSPRGGWKHEVPP